MLANGLRVAQALPSNPPAPRRALLGTPRGALSQLAWAHLKAVEPTPAAGNSPNGELARAADAQG
jgi:hypothetical protein